MLFRHAATVALCLLTAIPAHAATFCVGSSAGLQNALDAAASNGEPDEIRLEFGIFVPPNAGTSFNGFHFEPNPAVDDDDLKISGGWIDGCTRLTGTALASRLSGDLQTAALSAFMEDTTLTLRNLSIFFGNPAGNQAVLQIIDTGGGSGLHVQLERIYFASNASDRNTLWVSVDGEVRLLGCDFVNNVSGQATADISPGDDEGVYILNNTFADNETFLNGNIGGLNLDDGTSLPGAVVVNNIFWGNEGVDFWGDPSVFSHNVIEDLAGGANGPNNLQVDPLFSGEQGDHRLQLESPARDSGTDLAPFLPLFDLLGVPRPQNLYDRGAFEYPGFFADGFESGDTSAWSATVGQ